MNMYEEYQREQENEKEQLIEAGKKFIKRAIGLFLIVISIIVALIVFFNSFDVIQAGHAGVAYNLSGGVENKVLKTGWKWHSPLTNVIQYPTSKETVYLVKSKKEGKATDDSFNVNTADGKSVNVDVTYTYAMQEDKLPYIFTRFRRATAETINDTFIKQQLKGAIQAVTTGYSVVEVYGGEKRNEITTKVQKELHDRMAKEGIDLEDFTFQDIRPDDATLASIQKIVDAKNQEELLRQQNKNLQQEQVNKELEAQTAKKVAIVQSEQAAEQTRINSEAEANRVKTVAAAQAEANEKLSNSITDKILKKQLIEVLPNVKFPTILGSNGSILNIPEDMLKSVTPAPAK